MDAKKIRASIARQDILDESGQGIIEFIMILPVLFVLTALMVRVSTVTQMAIVNQKYARAQTTFLTYNSPYYPELRFKQNPAFGSMILGVADNITDESNDGRFEPVASTFTISRPGQDIGSDEPGEEPDKRGKVRVRNTVALCSAFNQPIDENVDFDFCRNGVQ